MIWNSQVQFMYSTYDVRSERRGRERGLVVFTPLQIVEPRAMRLSLAQKIWRLIFGLFSTVASAGSTVIKSLMPTESTVSAAPLWITSV
jgi:hypothetical protein